MFVYVIVCSETLKIYVGQHKGEDLQHYLQQKQYEARTRLSARSHLYAAMRKHPRESWSIHPLVSGIEDRKTLDETEQLLIYALKSQHPDVGYNICDGGEGFRGPHSEETKRKISEEHKQSSARWHTVGQKQTPETVAKRIAKIKGQTRTPEQVAKIAAGRKGKGLGFHHVRSEETKRRIGEKNKAGWTPERRIAWSEYKKAHPTGVAVKIS
jgi:group I intron endonuclease